MPPLRHALILLLTAVLLPNSALAYIGPGAGFAFLGSAAALLLTLLMIAATLLFWPITALWRWLRGRGISRAAKTKRVVILGLDGLDPGLVDEYMAADRLPHLAQLKAEGCYRRLGTTVPAISPVAWSTFQTGVNPGAHNIFDFLSRDKRNYVPSLSSTSTAAGRSSLRIGNWRLPLSRSEVRLLRRSQPFWKVLGRQGIFSNVIRVPISYPPEPFHGSILSAMCTPDLRGTQGTCTLFREQPASAASYGKLEAALVPSGGAFRGKLLGPPHPFREQARPLSAEFLLEPLDDSRALLTLQGQQTQLRLGELSEWLRVEFRFLGCVKIRGICRFSLRTLKPELRLYASPVNVDPEHPALPISAPAFYAQYFAKRLGLFGTLGLMEDTWGRNEGALDDQGFLDQAYLTHAEREQMLFDALAKTRQGMCVAVFDASDRIQHMFWRYRAPDHPAALEDPQRFAGVIADMYEKMDGLVGRVCAQLQPDDVLIVMSDHGFSSFRRGINLNSWLRDQGYLTLRDDLAEPSDYLRDVDWSRTQAFALGLTGIYLNRIGREAQGIVADADAGRLQRELRDKLIQLCDPDTGERAVRNVYLSEEVYRGAYVREAPDLILGCEPGYRVSWESVTGSLEADVFSDNTKAWSGDHHVDPAAVPGVFFSNRSIESDGPTLLDLAPSVLDLFAVPVPKYMEGRPLFGASS